MTKASDTLLRMLTFDIRTRMVEDNGAAMRPAWRRVKSSNVS